MKSKNSFKPLSQEAPLNTNWLNQAYKLFQAPTSFVDTMSFIEH